MHPIEQHRNAVRASNILYAGLGVSFLLSAIGLFTAKLPAGTWSPLFGMVLLVHLLAALLYYAIRLGKRWAKLLLLLFVAFNVVTTGWSLLSGNEEVLSEWRADVWDALKEAITFAADIVALVLLFRKSPV
ncbi:MAG: hypothetical protein EOO63_11690 [Hymenobacter sp.]|nr:MAG: hypothetical protein EOO63_11690 [Hymenobacter sp.]